MKEKIIFWLGSDLTHFCIAYYLQKMYDCELYAIIDITDKPKKFFLDQKLVNFKKIWFFHDFVKLSNSPDIHYLSSFEKKYNIPIWKLAINERIFYRFYNFHKYSENEILSIDESACKLFENILNEIKPSFVITKEPAFHHLEIFYQLSKAKGAKVLVLSQPKIGYKCRISDDPNVIDEIEELNKVNISGRRFQEMRDYRNSLNISKQIKTSVNKHANSKSELFKAAYDFLFKSDNIIEKTHYNYFGRTKWNVLSYMIKMSFKKKFREKFIEKNLILEPDFSENYIYFPMGVDLERNILIGAPYFTNQTEVIRHIAKSLPVGYKLYVKENPAQSTREWRSKSEYEEIMRIPNVSLIHPKISNEKLLEHCSLVITIAGSSGFEATFYEKPSIVFSDVVYSILPSVHKVCEIEKLPELIRECLLEKIHVEDLDRYLTLLEKITFDFDLFEFQTKYLEHFYFGGHLVNTEISDSQMKEFLDKNKIQIEKLTTEHIKKLNDQKN